jgi:hypothetical protein
MGQARNRGTREQRVAEAIARQPAEAQAARERIEAEERKRQIDHLAKAIVVGTLAGPKE